jgi:diguanylate cyclase (GGDEF)-like protein
MLNYFSSGLRLKLVLLVVAGIVSAFTIIGAFRVHVEKQQITEEMRRSGQERVEMIAEAVTNLLVGYDYSNMESLTDRFVQQQDVQHVIIRNNAGKVMVSRNKPGLPGQATLSFAAPVLFTGEQIGSVDLQLSLARMEAEINRTYRDVILEQIFFGFFLGLLIYFAASSVIVKPIARISEHMKSIIGSKDGAVLEELQMTSHDEIGDLARIFNNLNRKVFDAQFRLREKIDLAGSALMKTNEQLQQRSQELEQRSQDLEKALNLVEKLAVTDSLTDLRNRRYFDDNLASTFARAQRFNEPLCLILLDVDFFKKVNDTYGHAAGDTVLQAMAHLFRSRTRETDISARLGGDEFSFLLYRTNRTEGMLFAELLLKLVHEMVFTFHDQSVRVGLSIGLACNWDDIHSIEALYGAADEALYEAKRRGRNQVIAYPFAAPNENLKSV